MSVQKLEEIFAFNFEQLSLQVPPRERLGYYSNPSSCTEVPNSPLDVPDKTQEMHYLITMANIRRRMCACINTAHHNFLFW